MDKNLKTLAKLLSLKNRGDLIALLKSSKSDINVSSQYGSYWNSFISEFIILSPVEDYAKLKEISSEDKKLILELIREIFPPAEESPEIVTVKFKILLEDESSDEAEGNQVLVSSKSIRVFLSYSSKDSKVAGQVKSYLETYFGLEVFLAHEDLEGGVEFESVIIENLKSTDFFMPLISSNFKESEFTDQETGMAVVLGRRVLPISIENGYNPSGFIAKIQATKLKIEYGSYYEWINFCKKIIAIILKDPIHGQNLKNLIIEAFGKSRSFEVTNNFLEILQEYEPYDKDQINKITDAVMNNSSNWNELYHVPNYMKKFIKTHRDYIDKSKEERIKRYFSYHDVLFKMH